MGIVGFYEFETTENLINKFLEGNSKVAQHVKVLAAQAQQPEFHPQEPPWNESIDSPSCPVTDSTHRQLAPMCTHKHHKQ